MKFKKFKNILQNHVELILKDQNVLFTTEVDKDKLWETYLNSFPEGTNEIYRKRKEYDCSCCRHFIKSFGNVVVIKDNKVISIWDFEIEDKTYQPVVNNLSVFVKSSPIQDVFITKVAAFGTDKNYEKKENNIVRTWEHFYVNLPSKFVTKSSESEDFVTNLEGKLT